MPHHTLKKPSFNRPFWLSASNFYVLAAAITLAVFFLIWGLLHDGSEEPAWIPAGVSASLVLFAAVIVREIILRNARRRFNATRQLDRNLLSALPKRLEADQNKLTIEKNAAIVREIRNKSDAAKLLSKYAEGHREVVVLCTEYLQLNERELKTVGVGSPRIAALRRGKEIAEEIHHYHILQWAEHEVRALTNEAKLRTKSAEKIESAQRALAVIDAAVQHYPLEPTLLDSAAVISDFVTAVKVSDLMTRAERAALKSNNKLAERLYTEAQREVRQRPALNADLSSAAERIDEELEKIRKSIVP